MARRLALLLAALGIAAAGVALWRWWPRSERAAEAPAAADAAIGGALATLDGEARRLFRELAVGEEPGARIHKWRDPLRVELDGAITGADRRAVAAAVADLNAWLPDPGVRLVAAGGSARLHVTEAPPDPRFPVSLTLGPGGVITAADVTLPLGGLPPRRRARLIYEGLARALGLHHPTRRRADSIFYYGPGFSAWRYTPLDRQLIAALYAPAISPGTPAASIDAALARLAVQPSE